MSKTQIDGKPITPVPANIPEELAPVYEWLVENGRSLAYQLAVIVLVVVVAIAFTRSRAAKLENASAALLSTTDVVGLEELNGRFGGTKIGPLIRLRLARAYYDAGQFDSAKEAYAKFAKRNSKHQLTPQARLGLAASEEALREFQQAIADYRAVDAPAGSPVAVMARMGEARATAAAGDKVAAKVLIDALVADTKDTAWESVVERMDGVIDRFDGFREISFSDQLSALRSAMAPSDAADINSEAADDEAAEAPAAEAPAAETAAEPAAEPAAEKAE
jgi:predicted negative regulator of RcsB-dependent stress response